MCSSEAGTTRRSVRISTPCTRRFSRPDEFGKVVPWLMLHREGLSVLVHPSTGDGYGDHMERSLWLGERACSSTKRRCDAVNKSLDKDMKRLHSAKDPLMIGHLKNVLATVRHQVRGAQESTLISAAGELPPVECWPELWVVDDETFGRARVDSQENPGAAPSGEKTVGLASAAAKRSRANSPNVGTAAGTAPGAKRSAVARPISPRWRQTLTQDLRILQFTTRRFHGIPPTG